MKKEGLVFVLFITVFFVLGAGCEKQEQDIDFSKSQALTEWSESFPRYYYYYSNSVEPEFQSQVDLALETGNIEECEKLIISSEEESGESFQRKVDALHNCSTLLTKKKAFAQKDYQGCGDLYAESSDNNDYDECLAPITAYIAITNQNKEFCKERINNKLLLELCEDDYERFS